MNKKKEKAEPLPLTESTFLILLSLTEPLHGYGIMQRIESLSSGRVKMGPGTLYGGLKALMEKKMIQRVNSGHDEENRKKMYALTELGRSTLESEYMRMRQLTEVSKDILKRGKS